MVGYPILLAGSLHSDLARQTLQSSCHVIVIDDCSHRVYKPTISQLSFNRDLKLAEAAVWAELAETRLRVQRSQVKSVRSIQPVGLSTKRADLHRPIKQPCWRTTRWRSRT